MATLGLSPFDEAPQGHEGYVPQDSGRWPAFWQEPWRAEMGADWQAWQAQEEWQSRRKRRFCTSFPEVGQCRRGAACAFAHTREEITAPLLEEAEEQQLQPALTDDFFMFKYKIHWCPIGVQHEWHNCVYAHNYQDARRPVDIGYGARLCPYWSKKDTGAEYSQRCPLGLRCPYSHGAKEQLYHPQYFKTVICRDVRGKVCPRQKLCAFHHHRNEKRPTPQDDVDYSMPLPAEKLPEKWVADFLSPPFMPETTKQKEEGKERGDAGMMPIYYMPLQPETAQSEFNALGLRPTED
ncbi:unnamed protein product [Effrenium voratum]|uniref:C3H1-type domain-containing protein n=1 Tax=Effrenium voratum TaxID=2562239 RepID=A0AA36HNF8_9DINO|nr:unnamed protein product [Effrenium voratum]|mmetsp:Transcript_65341/g.156061  ORF Transcript_65341/g.156061 Transcript_65341/m.156061 type:complete len:294 (-) Transcript_65341:129-1010(-)|eukprot:CAMPEP_0181432710 /NCGR_PEP_ID=MMETSP1110-20121109/18912_1 /TAXON_ID=174948 /ORGANISM="Symbiodinium sp., Strain CCMP421" /LENGTH=293 /DNA_ID=CAMNT_0023556131 /DNA_START=31 /DNA_END=912 /DNA_ORIENTATION=+